MDFEKLEVWRRSCELSVNIYKTLKELRDFGFKDQLTRASLSVPSNIAEGMVKPTPKEKIRFLHIANGSCAEMRTQILVGVKIGYLAQDVGADWIRETREISAMLSGLIHRIDQKNLQLKA